MNKLRTAIRVTEIDGLSDTLIRNFRADSNASSDEFLSEILKEIETLSAKITTAILQDKIVSSLDSVDKVRNETLKNFYALVNGYIAIPIEEKKEAALPIKLIADKYFKAGIVSTTYVSKSSMIESMLEELSKEEMVKNISVLEGLSQSVDKIREAQNAFIQANDDYIKATTNRGAPASSYKAPLLSCINTKLIPYLNAMIIARNGKYLNFAKGAETEIARVNTTINQRNGQKKGITSNNTNKN